MSIGSKIKKLRQSKGLTQTDLGKILGVEKSTISMYENDKSRPDDTIKLKIADYFDVTVDYLLGKSYDPKLSRKDEIDIAKQIEKINDSLENTEDLMFHGEILDDETRELLKKSLENTIYFSKILAKEKFNPNKNKDKKE